MNEPQDIYDLWLLVIVVVYIFFAWATFSAARHHENTDNKSFFAGIGWPLVWVFLMLRGWDSYFLSGLKTDKEEIPEKPVRLTRTDILERGQDA